MIEHALSIKFNDRKLIEQALTHPSFSKAGADYERMEFLGDHVLGLVIAEILYKKFPDENEGQLTKRLAGLICGETLVRIAKDINLGDHLKMAQSEAASGGRENRSTLENAMEAIIAAIYLDQGLEPAREFITRAWADIVESMQLPPKDAKSSLQEWAQGRALPLPEYEVTTTTGPSHAPVFEVTVKVQGLEAKTGKGSSKRIAEQEAAKEMLEQITDN
jgi:ribonuclease-3